MMEAQWIVDRSRLRTLLQEEPTWTHQEYATTIGRSLSWVKKWVQRLCQADPDDDTVLHSCSRARHQPPPTVATPVVARILALRDNPPLPRVLGPLAILYYLHQDETLHEAGYRLPTSSATIWKILDRHQRILRPKRHKHEPVVRPEPMTTWQMDFKDVSVAQAEETDKRQHQVETLNTDFHAATTKVQSMKQIILIILMALIAACSGIEGGESNVTAVSPSPTNSQALTGTAVPQPESNWWQPAPGLSWQWQLDQPVDISFDVAVYDVDLFETETAVIADLHASGRKAICYLSAGSWEDWRPDAAQFPDAVIGKNYGGWPGEKWLDIRQIDLLAPIMRARLDLCREKGFDGIEPDNIDAYTNHTGFPLTYEDQLAYNVWLAEEAHKRGLSIGLKNDGEQAVDLLSYFDWALTEDCFDQEWCEEISPFIAAGKPVFAAEYTDTGIAASDFCPQAVAMGFSAILKNRNLDAWREVCPEE